MVTIEVKDGSPKKKSSPRSKKDDKGARVTELVVKTVVGLSIVAIVLVLASYTQAVCWFKSSSCVRLKRLTLSDASLQEKSYPAADDESTPKVALLFLISNGLPHERMWRAFFERAANLSFRNPPPTMSFMDELSREQVKKFEEINSSTERKLLQLENPFNEIVCSQEEKLLEREFNRLMEVSEHPSKIVEEQSLFSVYIHPPIGFMFPENHTFHGTEIENRVDLNLAWGTFRLVEAELRLVEAALKDKRNKQASFICVCAGPYSFFVFRKFVLLSETCVPLYPPEVIYSQLLSEKKSRMRACDPDDDVQSERYKDGITGKHINKSNWHKNKQWFALNRAHAKLLVQETYVKKRFREYCDAYKGSSVLCIPDEHYIATTLNVYNLGHETDCKGSLTFSQFLGGPHPLTFFGEDVDPGLFHTLRHQGQCYAGAAMTTATAIFDGVSKAGSCLYRNRSSIDAKAEADLTANWVGARGYKPLDTSCELFARKFMSDSVNATLRAILSCKGGAFGYWC